MIPITQATLAKRPAGRAGGTQSWRNLLFLHWRLPADALASQVPSDLTIETFEGNAWLGVVPFAMAAVRPWWSPAMPGISWFFETNVRTYVTHPDHGPGVWFFSLDANSRLAVAIAQRYWHLNYRYATLSLHANSQSIEYHSLGRADGSGRYAITVETAAVSDDSLRTATPGSLDYFLLERYLLYVRDRAGRLRTGRVHHAAYRFHTSPSVDCTQQLTAVNRLPACDQPPDHVAYSPGVDVEVFSLKSSE